MRTFSGLILLLCAPLAWSQSTDDPQVTAAKAELAKVQKLVEAGALPKLRLVQAQDAVADAQDAAYLSHTAYGDDLTLDQVDQMVATANRRLQRREKAYDTEKKLVDAGAAPATALQPFELAVAEEKKECDVVGTRASLVREIGEQANAEESAFSSPSPAAAVESYSGSGVFAYATYAKVEVAYREHFGKSMPVSAIGETAVHRALGFDHRGRVDVALNPDQPEGQWLLEYLKDNHIPYFAFRHAVPGKATGAHIHIGPSSTRLASGG